MSYSADAQRIAAAMAGLRLTYKPEGVGVWLYGKKKSLGGATPISLLERGFVTEFVRAVERIGDWTETPTKTPKDD